MDQLLDGGRLGVLEPQHEVEVQGIAGQAPVAQVQGGHDHVGVENLHLGLDATGLHLPGQGFHQLGRILVDAGGKVHRAGGEGGHLAGYRQPGPPALQGTAGAAAGGYLDDEAGAPGQEVHHLLEDVRVVGGVLLAVAHVDVQDGGPGVLAAQGVLGDLPRRDRHVGSLGLPGQRAGGGHGDDELVHTR